MKPGWHPWLFLLPSIWQVPLVLLHLAQVHPFLSTTTDATLVQTTSTAFCCFLNLGASEWDETLSWGWHGEPDMGLDLTNREIMISWSQHHITTSSLCPWSTFWEQGRPAESTFQGQGRGGWASNLPGSSSCVNQWLRPLDHLSQHFSRLLQRNLNFPPYLKFSVIPFGSLLPAAKMVRFLKCEFDHVIPA